MPVHEAASGTELVGPLANASLVHRRNDVVETVPMNVLATAEESALFGGWVNADSVGNALLVLVAVLAYRVAQMTNRREEKERKEKLKNERTEKLADLANFLLQNRDYFENIEYPIFDSDNRYESIIIFDDSVQVGKRITKHINYGFVIVRDSKNYKNLLSFVYKGHPKVDPVSIEIDKEPKLNSNEWNKLFDALKSTLNSKLTGGSIPSLPMSQFYEKSADEISHITKLTGKVRGHTRMCTEADVELAGAILTANVGKVIEKVKDVTHIDARDQDGRTFLHYSVSDVYARLRDTYTYFESDRNGGKRDSSYASAIQCDINEIVSILIKEGANVNARDNLGNSVIYAAAFSGDSQTIDILARSGAKVNKVSKHNNSTALHIAANLGWERTMRKLIEHGATINKKNLADEIPLHYAASSGWTSAMELLIEHGAKIEEVDNRGESPLHKASFSGWNAAVEMLIELNADVNRRDNLGDAALHKASFSGYLEVVEALIACGARIDAVNRKGDTPLHRASFSNRDRTASVLIENGANVNAENFDGETPLIVALKNMADGDMSPIIGLLIEFGASVTHKDTYGISGHDLIMKKIHFRNKGNED